MSVIKEFITAAQEAVDAEQEVDDGLHFMILGFERPDGTMVEDREVIAYKPTGGQIALAMARMGKFSSTTDRMAGLIDFFVEVLDEGSHQYVVNRLMDRTDPFGLDHVTDITYFLMEEWSGRPIRPSAASTPSRKNGGRKSTQRTPTSA